MAQKQSGGGARKIGRTKRHASSLRYKNENRQLRNKYLRMRRHMKQVRHANDQRNRLLLAEFKSLHPNYSR